MSASPDPPVWFITGCSTGLGRAVATQVLAAGARAVVTARDPASVADLVAAHPERALAVALDVADPAQASDAVAAAEERFGRIDVLLNNAGYGYLAAIEEGEDAEVRRLFDTNVHGLVDVTKAVLPGMRARRAGRILNVSSFGGLAAFGATGYYHATKFAVEGVSESLAAEVAHLGIHVTLIEPGGLRTNWSGPSMRHAPERIADYAPSAGARRERTTAGSGHAPGDPVRAAAAIATVAAEPDPPLRLLLGSDALAGVRARAERLRAETDAWEHLTTSTDFPS